LSPIKNPLSANDYTEEEIAIPVEHFQSAIRDIFALYKKYRGEGFELVGFMTCRFVQGSTKALLSPAYNQDSVYISLVTLSSFAKYRDFYQEFENLMAQYPFARPHWGKFNTLTQDRVSELWNNNLAQFNKVRAALDPNNLFSNAYLDTRLGPAC
jgi:L-gulonolactone oxidase